MLVSVVIRTLNEEKYLEQLLAAIKSQDREDFNIEIVIIDSGSTDKTVLIANKFQARITYINKSDFTFGRSLNYGSDFAQGDILVYVSGHCIPTNRNWIKNIIKPIRNNIAGYVYGCQRGKDSTKYSETKIFEKYFPDQSKLPQKDFFCNNANSAIDRKVWTQYKFNEEITGLEDMDLAKRYFLNGGKIAYSAEACVYHIHDESFAQTKNRYEREAFALKKIMPELNVSMLDTLRYIFVGITKDMMDSLSDKCFLKESMGIVKFRIAQYMGTYSGNNQGNKLSLRQKESYYYPTKKL